MSDLISRQAAVDALYAEMPGLNPVAMDIILTLPSAQPERLTDDDFETIRIHLNAYKEKLCNQNRWEEAEEYQRIIDRFMAFASAEPEIIHCRDCKYSEHWYRDKRRCFLWVEDGIDVFEDGFCNYAERRTDE